MNDLTIAHSGVPRRTLAFGREIVFKRGTGGVVIDSHGREYIDFVLGYGSVVLGHSTEAYRRLVQQYCENGTLLPGYTTWHYEMLALLLGENDGHFSAAFFKTGSESVTAAIRLASDLSSRAGVIRCGFLGWHDVQLGKSIRWHEPPHSPLRSALRFTDGFRGLAGDEEVFNWTTLEIGDLATIIDRNRKKIACLVIDTYQVRLTTRPVSSNISRFNASSVVSPSSTPPPGMS